VLGCFFAHLIAMKTLVEGDYDFILEDNVRVPIVMDNIQVNYSQDRSGDAEEHKEINTSFDMQHDNDTVPICAQRIYNTIEASQELEEESGKKCHLRYYGWLGSRPNLEFIIKKHIPRTRFVRTKNHDKELSSIFPFPIKEDLEFDDNNDFNDNQEEEGNDDEQKKKRKAGGTAIWGAYAYWVSQEGYKAIIDSLQKDVGSILWKGKRMRHHMVKPIDKVMPRKIISTFSSSSSEHDDLDDGDMNSSSGRDHVHVATNPAFFRAPMLTSQIHSQWDAEFCKSTEFQMISCLDSKTRKFHDENDSLGSVWNSLWLTVQERRIVEYKKKTKKWLTLGELSQLSESNK